MPNPKAIIFDLDGVLTDTSEYHYRAWKHLADDEGIPFTHEENDAHLRGVGRRESLAYLIRGRQYTEEQIQEMMEGCGLSEIVFSNNIPYWHAVGKKK